jgi:predicted RND superfamily exporter protein
VTGALTTAAAFYVLRVTDFRGLAELGIIAGTGILFSLVSMLTILPSLMTLRFRAKGLSSGSGQMRESFLGRALARLAAVIRDRAGTVITIAALGTLILCYFAPRVKFDYNFLHIQPVTSTTAEYEEVLMERTGLAPSFNVIVKNDLASLDDACTKLVKMPSVSRVDSASTLVPVDQQQKLPVVRSVVGEIAELKQHVAAHHMPPDLTGLVNQYGEMQKGLQTALKARALVGNEQILSEIEKCSRAVGLFLMKYESADKSVVGGRLAEFSEGLFIHVREEMDVLASERQIEPITFSDLPENIRTRVVGKTGKYAAYVFPSQSIWNKAFLDRFNADVLSVAPDAAGTALFAQTMLDVAGHALRQSSILVSGAVVVLVFLHFRKATLVPLALLAVGIGVIWMLGLMDIVSWHYNPINMMAVPLMLGIGIDSGVHIVHRFYENGRDIENALSTSGRAITVSSLTTIAGFACLLLSTHRGLIGLGKLMVLGVGACLIASLVVLTATLSLLASTGVKK